MLKQVLYAVNNMKYNFSILSPHPDDEFIGCRKFIEIYGNYINNIIFLTNGEVSVGEFNDMEMYIKVRREESRLWISEHTKAEIHYLNVPDNLDIEELNNNKFGKIFKELHNVRPSVYLRNKIEKIIGDDILLVPSAENHPSHLMAFNIAEILRNMKIYYVVHKILTIKMSENYGCYFKKNENFGLTKINYVYVYSDNELLEKRKEFQLYYNSQYNNFLKTGLNIYNWENYLSPIILKLTNEDNMFKVGDSDVD